MSRPRRTNGTSSSPKFKASVKISLSKQRTAFSEQVNVNGVLAQLRKGTYRVQNKFYKRTCIQFVPSKKDANKCGCGLLKQEHRPEALRNITSSEFVWDPITNSIWEPTDAYGQLEFSGAGQTSRAKYIRVAHDTKAADVLDMVLVREWKLKLPKLLISVTGGAKSFVLHPKLKQVLRQGLLKAARTTGAWIFTGGTNTGVMKHVGEAVRGHSVASFPAMNDSEELKLIGIATWGIVEHRETLVDNKGPVTYHMTSSMESHGACLDNNHSHFILVDDGTNGQYGKEIAFRASLENVISKKKISEDKSYGIPVVLLVLEGGPNTILTVLESVTRSPAVPVVIAEGSGRAADILAYAHRFVIENDGPEITEFQDVVEHRQLVEKIVQAYPESKEEQVLTIYKNVLKCVGKKRYITIFRVDEEGVDIDRAILRALLKAQHASPADQLSLALLWNRVDIAMSEIFVDNQKWQMEELESAMMDALSSDRVEFVSLLLENGVSIGYFLTKKRLIDLYRERSKVSVAFQQVIGEFKLRTGFSLPDIDAIINKMLRGMRQSEISVTTGLKETALGILKTPQQSTRIEHFQNPYNELFLWAVLCNMQKMALFMWERGDNNLARALIGARMYMEMAEKIESDELRNDVYEEVLAHAQEFKDVALALLDECYRANEFAAQKLLTYNLKDWCGHSCLSLAVALDHEEFVAHVSCQSLLSEIWMGAMKSLDMPSFMVILGIIVPPTICCLEFKTKKELSLLPVTQEEYQYDMQVDGDSCGSSDEADEQDALSPKKELRKSRRQLRSEEKKLRSNKYSITATDSSMSHYSPRNLSVGKKFLEFYRAPITKFWANVIAYMMFLMLFSYVILVTESGNSLIAEVVLIVFVCSLCTEEIRQIIQSDASATDNRLKAWASSKWNICDGIAVLLFFVGMGLKFHSSTAHIGHVVYSLDIMLWIIRLLDIFSVSKHLGPYVVMIGRMTIDMLYFLVVMVVFLLAYGVAQQAILFPKQKPTWNIISMILFRPYFQTYGELFITDPLQLDNATTEFSTPRYDEYSGTISTLILAFYLLVANILLLNLLIAIFNNTFSEVQANSNQIWKFQRYGLVMEYAQRPFLIPPFIIFNHVIMLLICTWNKICCCCRKNTEQRERESDNRLKLFLEKHELKELLTFEEHCLYSYLYNKDTLFNATAEERVRVIGNRIESIATQLEETAKESFTRGMTQKKTLTAMSGRLKNLERNTKAILAMLSTRYGMSPSKYAMEIDSGDEELDEHGHGIRREKSASELISHFKAAARNPIVRHGLKLAAAAKASKDDDSPSPPCTKRRRGSGESPATSPQASEDEKPTTSKARGFLDFASRHSKRARDDLEGVTTVHLKARRTPYPLSNVERYPLTDNQVEWKAIVLGYNPPRYTADTILSSNADANFQSLTAGDVKLSFNEVDGNINRQSYTGHYDVIEGLPRNLMGRTGLVGRGLLEHWGPNHTSCHILTRWRRSRDGSIEERDTHPVLEFVAIKSHDSQEWKLPENKSTLDKTSTKAFIDELCENILLAVEPHSELTKQEKKVQLDKLLQELGMEVSHGYVDDERNTDNAWVETMVMNYHDETGEILGDIQFVVRDGKYLMAWLTASCQLNIPENQVIFLRKVAKLHNAFF